MNKMSSTLKGCVHRTGLLFVGLLLGMAAITTPAETDNTDPSNCISCHQDNVIQGVHSGSHFGATNQVAVCLDCHGTVGNLTLHKEGELSMNIFSEASPTPIIKQNAACLACHEPKKISVAHWTHNAHGNSLACSSCHSLHPVNDPVLGLSKKATIKLCVDCHAAQTLRELGGLQ